jgi:hypothetical protein
MEQYTHDGAVEKGNKEFMKKTGFIKRKENSDGRKYGQRKTMININGTTYSPPISNPYERKHYNDRHSQFNSMNQYNHHSTSE